MSSVDIAQLRQLLAAATPGPWSVVMDERDATDRRVMNVNGPPITDDFGNGPETYSDPIIETDCGVYPPDEPDARLIVAAVNALPELLAIAEAAQGYYNACADVRNDSADRGFACDRLFAALTAVDAARKAGT